jgi:hypothetical protein
MFGVDVVGDEDLVFESFNEEMMDQANPLRIAREVDGLIQLVKFTNILRAAFTCADKKAHERFTVFLRFWDLRE